MGNMDTEVANNVQSTEKKLELNGNGNLNNNSNCFINGFNHTNQATENINGNDGSANSIHGTGISNGKNDTKIGAKGVVNGANGTKGETNGILKSTNGVSSGTNGVSNGTNGISNGTNGVLNGTSGFSKATNGVSNGTNGVSNGTNGVSNGTNGTVKATNNGRVNGTNGFSNGGCLSEDENDENVGTDKKTHRLKMNLQNVETFVKLNGNEGESSWAKTDTVDQEDLQVAVEKALKDITHAAANGVEGEAIIFKDEGGNAPPITMTILKQRSSFDQKREEEQVKKNSLINPHFIGEVARQNENKDQTISSAANGTAGSRTIAVNLTDDDDVPVPGGRTESTQKSNHKNRLRNEPLSGLNHVDIIANDKSYPISSSTGPVVEEEALLPPKIHDPAQHEKLHLIVKRKQEERQAQFEKLESQYKLDADAQRILSLAWDPLVSQLQERQITAKQVLSAYIAKSLKATAFCNAITEYNPKAMEIAENLDRLTTVKGPLHGIPFCVKDDTDLEGMDSTLGYAKHCFNPAHKSAALVMTLVDLGAIPFCKTNVPQTLLNYASDNPVFGTTSSSHNQKLGPGGSSSGTGALVGSLGAIFGTGTDIGGSLRIPAHFNGVASLKPTGGRLSVRGISAVLPNIMGLDATSGIIGCNARVVTSVFKSMLTDNFHTKYDPKIPPLPWNSEIHESTRKLRIGYFSTMPFFPPVGDTVEVVEKAVEALKSQGHTLIPMEIPEGARLMKCAANFLLADQSIRLNKLWKGEQVAKCAELNKLGARCPAWVLKLASYLMHRKILSFLYSPALGSILDAGAFKSSELWDNSGEQKKLNEEILATWTRLQLDCCVCPVMPFPAIPVNLPGLLPIATVYTMTWNVVNFPAGVVKFGVESGKNIDNYENRGDQALKMSQQACKESIGSPIGVQVVGLPFKEELVLRIMEELDNYAIENKL